MYGQGVKQAPQMTLYTQTSLKTFVTLQTFSFGKNFFLVLSLLSRDRIATLYRNVNAAELFLWLLIKCFLFCVLLNAGFSIETCFYLMFSEASILPESVGQIFSQGVKHKWKTTKVGVISYFKRKKLLVISYYSNLFFIQDLGADVKSVALALCDVPLLTFPCSLQTQLMVSVGGYHRVILCNRVCRTKNRSSRSVMILFLLQTTLLIISNVSNDGVLLAGIIRVLEFLTRSVGVIKKMVRPYVRFY